MTFLLAAARAVHFASLMLIFGGSAYALLLRRGRHGEPGAAFLRKLFSTAAALAIISGIAWLCLIAGQMSGSWQSSVDPGVVGLAATETRFGRIFLVRLIGLIALAGVCIGGRSRLPVIAILSGLLLASIAPVSHAAASGGDIALIGAANDALHLLAAGFWIGALVVLALLIRRSWTDAPALVGPLRIFSVWGSLVVGLLILTGVVNALTILPLSAMSLHNPYLELLMVKVALAAAMVALAALNRWRFAPALPSGRERDVQHLATSVAIETTLGFVIVGIVGYLGTMSPH